MLCLKRHVEDKITWIASPPFGMKYHVLLLKDGLGQDIGGNSRKFYIAGVKLELPSSMLSWKTVLLLKLVEAHNGIPRICLPWVSFLAFEAMAISCRSPHIA
jgi:hypothetical protein